MWFYIKWTIRIVFWGLIFAVLNYTLPQHDVARITDAYPKRVDFGENRLFYSHAGSGDAEGVDSRDVFFIAAILKNGKPMEYRNEDTAWSWPPYFKFDTASVQTEASDMKSSAEAPKWVVIRHYGWRSNLYSIYPNALHIRQVDDPNIRIIPWFNIIFLTVLGALAYGVWVRWRRFRQARIDPVLEDWNEKFEAAGDEMDEKRGRFRRWLATWRR